MTTYISNVFSSEEIDYLTESPEVMDAKSKLNNSRVVYFTIPLTETIRNSIFNNFGLNLSNISEIPMRWIKGDTTPHIDVGSSKFEKTYLAYLNNNPGNFIIDGLSYPITANTAFVFDEGLRHMTQNTGEEPRLLLGPMNEFALQVGGRSLIFYYSNYNDAIDETNRIATGNSYVLGDSIYGNIGQYTAWRVAKVYDNTYTPLPFPPTSVYHNGFNLSTLDSSFNYFDVYPSAPCFLEGTKVLTLKSEQEEYLPI
jgi:hypothetical protein